MDAALHIELPEFLVRANAAAPCLPLPDERMRFVLGLARENIAVGGGPFAAAVFERVGGRLVAAGVNRVVATHCSSAHAEVLALSLAQQKFGSHDLGAAGLPACELVSSAEPCAMCLGAVLWSGVRHLVCGARGEDVAALGFDEGPRSLDWISELHRRGVDVTTDVQREAALAILRDYASGGGLIYNARSGR